MGALWSTGAAIGAAVAGALVQASGGGAAFAFARAAGSLAVLAVLARGRSLEHSRDGAPLVAATEVA